MDDDLGAILEYCEAATEGPWTVEGGGGIHMDGKRDWYRVYQLQRAIIHPLPLGDANFIARARTDLPRITCELVEARKVMSYVRWAVDPDSAVDIQYRITKLRAALADDERGEGMDHAE